jgi:hypothetical protein
MVDVPPSTTTLGLLRRFDATYGRGGALLALALVASGMSSVVYRALVASRIGALDRSALATVLAVLLVCAAPFEGLFVLAARRASRADGRIPAWRTPAIQVAYGATLAAIAAGVALRLCGRAPGIVVMTPALVAEVAMIGAGVVPRGVLLGVGRPIPVAAALTTGMAARVGAALVLLTLGAGLGGVLTSLVFGEVVTTALLWRSAAQVSRTEWSTATGASDAPPLDLFRGSFEPGVAFASLYLFGLVPAMFAHRFLSGPVAGQFVAAYTAVRIMLFLPLAIAVVGIPKFARGGAEAVEALRVTLRIAAGSSLVAMILVAAIRPGFALDLVSNAPAAPLALLLLLGTVACALGLLGVLVTYHVVRGLPCAGTLLGALGFAIVIALAWHPSLGALITVVMLVSLAALARLLAGPALVGPAVPWAGADRRRAPNPETADLELSVIVPYYNPGNALRRNVLALVDALEREGVKFEVIAVSDGSTDGSDRSLVGLDDRVQSVALARNQGKGAALCAGIAVAHGHYLGFIDADGDIPAQLWHSFVTLTALYDPDIIVGSKRHSLSDVSYTPLRRVYSRLFQTLVHALFRIDVADTQTGIKVFRRDVLADVLPLLVEDGFVFDVELLVVAHRRRWRRVLEAPVRIEPRDRSTVSAHTAWKMFGQTIMLAARLYLTRTYDTPAVEPAPTSILTPA